MLEPTPLILFFKMQTRRLASFDGLNSSLAQSPGKLQRCNMTVKEWFMRVLTPWRLGGFGDFRKKNSSFRLPYQRPSSSANCARELFNGSNGLASLVDCTRKKLFAWGVWVFCE